MTHIYDIMDQIKGQIPLQLALENISNYNIDTTVFASESRQWAQMFLHTEDYPPYQIQQFDNVPSNETEKKEIRKIKKKKKLLKTENKDVYDDMEKLK